MCNRSVTTPESRVSKSRQPVRRDRAQELINLVHLRTQRYTNDRERTKTMGAQSVGIREFRDNLATYLLESDGPVAITRHGDTIGYYLPRRRKRTEAEKK